MTSKRNEDNWRELESLITLFEDTLKVTTKARNILTISNQETLGLLTNWEIPDFPYEEPVCTCKTTFSKGEQELHKIVRNVEQAVVNAQKIREKSESQQRLKVKPEDISPTVPYTHASAELKNVHKTSFTGKPGNTTQGNTLPKSRSTSKLVPPKTGENTIRKLPSKVSKVQTTYQKDFSVPSKMSRFRQQSASTRLCSRKETSAQDPFKLNEDDSSSKQVPLQNLSSKQAPLQNLSSKQAPVQNLSLKQAPLHTLQRLPSAQRPVALTYNESKKSNSISMDQACEQLTVNTCPVHGNAKLLQKQSSYVTLAEAVDVLGVPPEMVKYLRSYHNFVTHFQCEDKPIKMSKGKKAAEKFIGELVEVNGWQWKDVEQEPLGALFQECAPLFTEVFGTEQLSSNIEDRIKTLDKKCLKWFNLSESVDPHVYSVHQHKILSPFQDNLLLNGIWNFKNKRRSKVFQYIRYSSPVQWRKFFKNMQDIQRFDLQLQVFLELDNIVPLLEMYSPDDPSFILLFKAICTICDITKLCLPVIFKS